MTLSSKLMTLFPVTHFVFIILSIYGLVLRPSLWSLSSIFLAIYIYPLFVFRLHNIIFPIKEGKFNLEEKAYNPWWGAHQIQLLFYAIPQFEALLRVTPGAFSLWLRLWGSKVGKGVYWTPNIEIDDRCLVEIGDGALMGHKIEMLSHIVGPKNGHLSLMTKKIKIGKRCFVGAGSRLGPGATIEDGAFVPVLTDVYINQVITKESQLKYQGQKPESLQ
jgi:hypothetical protein